MSGGRDYTVVTAAYWGFTLTDGALRTLVLLHFYELGYSPFSLASLFVLYEFAGILSNLGGGWLAARFGISRMLAIGITLQISGLLMLSALQPSWSDGVSVAWVVAAQGVAGIAKDLTKTASKSAIKLTAPRGSGSLFKLVALFTGSKNAMKGIGFLLGGVLLELIGFHQTLWLLAGCLCAVLTGVLVYLPTLLGKAKVSRTAREFLSRSRGVNILAAARVTLFGAREVWFAVGLPVFLYTEGWTNAGVGGFLAVWTIGYGIVQAAVPSMVHHSDDGLSLEVPAARWWAFGLAVIPAALGFTLLGSSAEYQSAVVIVGLSLFGIAFAINSALHSYLILAYAGSKRAAEDVGFYYAANATGRLLGIILSGSLYQLGGLALCLGGAAFMLVVCWLTSLALPTQVRQQATV